MFKKYKNYKKYLKCIHILISHFIYRGKNWYLTLIIVTLIKWEIWLAMYSWKLPSSPWKMTLWYCSTWPQAKTQSSLSTTNTGKYLQQHIHYKFSPASLYHSCQIFYVCRPLCRLDYSSVSWRLFCCLKLLLVDCMYLLLQHYKTQIVSVAPRCQTGGWRLIECCFGSTVLQGLISLSTLYPNFKDHPVQPRHAKNSLWRWEWVSVPGGHSFAAAVEGSGSRTSSHPECTLTGLTESKIIAAMSHKSNLHSISKSTQRPWEIGRSAWNGFEQELYRVVLTCHCMRWNILEPG